MNSTELKKKIDERISNLELRMKDRYEIAFDVLGKQCFKANDNEFFMLTRMSWANAVVIEHADSEEEARKNRFEDGDLFNMDDLDEDAMFNAMIQEIEDT